MADQTPENPRARRIDGENTYQELLDAALSIWSEQGIGQVTMNAVARRAGRTRGTAYHHFADHAALIEAVRNKLTTKLEMMFDVSKIEARDGYGTVGAIVSDSPEVLRSYFSQLLRGKPNDDPLIAMALKHFRNLEDMGWLHDGVNPDYAAFVGIAMWLAEMLAVEMHSSPIDRKRAADSFADLNRAIMEGSFLKTAEQRSTG